MRGRKRVCYHVRISRPIHARNDLAAPVALVIAAAFFALPAPASAADPVDTEFFERHIRPLFVKHCYECHSEQEQTQKSGLLLDRESGWLEGGERGRAVVPGQPGASFLIEAIRRKDEDFSMPPDYALEEREVALLTRWVREGAPGPKEDLGETEFSQLGDQDAIFEKAQSHWAFQPPKKSTPPEVSNEAWNQHPIDRFVFADLKEAGLAPSPAADERTLVRRLSYDLTGLPPEDSLYGMEPGEIVNRLLDSPRFGEHFGRMWLDVARYADTANDYRPDTKTPHYYPYAFTYRDWVIDAFNEDLPYDEFVREQLAADLQGHESSAPEMAALGFLGVSPHRRMSHDFGDDAIDTTTRGFLGLTVSCARCHDHKFEPVPTEDYYSLYGVFKSIQRPEPWQLEKFPEIEGYEPTEKELADYREKRKKIDAEIEKAGDKTKGGNNRSVAKTIRETDLAELMLFHDGGPARALTVSEKKNPVTPAVFVRGNPRNRGDRVPRRFLEILDPEQEPFTEKNSGRLELANHIVAPDNPLTARVWVNRVWGFLMGDFLVDTPSNFGLEGEDPSHPELLDYLARDFVENGWSTKRLVRRIVSSRTYRQSSRVREDMAKKDPENQHYWRANRSRLRFEELRDSYLAVSGRIELEMKGRPGKLWGEDYTRRRSIYGYINRFNLDPTLRNFDFPSPVQTRAKRTESVVAPQALFLMNSPFVVDQADAVVEDLDLGKNAAGEAWIEALYRRILDREPSDAEVQRTLRFAEIEQNRDVDPWPLLAQALMTSNEFLYVD